MFLMDDFFRAPTFASATTSAVRDTKDAWVIEMDMPGVRRDRVEVGVAGRYLEVKGERDGERKTSYRERFLLPDRLRTADGITAHLDAGVLTVTVPKRETALLQIPVS